MKEYLYLLMLLVITNGFSSFNSENIVSPIAAQENASITINTETKSSTLNLESKENTNSILKYESSFDFPYNNMKFADKDTFKILKEAYESVDFYGEFEKGITDIYDNYKQKYKELLDNKAPFLIKESGEKLYINQYEYLKSYNGGPDLGKMKFYFFDMDLDGTPELCIHGPSGFTYIFKYVIDTDEFILWKELSISYYQLNGSRKMRWEGATSSFIGYIFYNLDENGLEECTVSFFEQFNSNSADKQSEDNYMLGLPKYDDKNMEIQITENMKKQAYFDCSHEIYYFRVTEEEYNSLTYDFNEARNIAMKNIQGVTYSYDELFEDLP